MKATSRTLYPRGMYQLSQDRTVLSVWAKSGDTLGDLLGDHDPLATINIVLGNSGLVHVLPLNRAMEYLSLRDHADTLDGLDDTLSALDSWNP